MKNKPHSHRNQNTFRFKSFNEKVKSIRVSSRNYILKKIEEDSESESLFWQTIQKWKELNLTIGFQDFQNALGREYQTVAQLLLHEDHIAETLRDHLQVADILTLPPILHALVAFARDIPDVFYEKHFNEALQQLVSIATTRTRCHETIENVFVSLVSLFTLLQKYIKNEFHRMYVENNVCELLSQRHPWYVNELAAQTVGNLVRKLNNKKDIFDVCLRRLKKNEEEIEGVGRLLFHSIKSDVARRLHSSVRSTLDLLVDMATTEKRIPREQTTKAICSCLKFMATHVTAAVDIPEHWRVSWAEDSKQVWPIFLKRLRDTDGSDTDSSTLSVLQFVLELVQFKKGALVVDFEQLIHSIASVISQFGDEVTRLSSVIVAKLITSTHFEVNSYESLHEFLTSFVNAKVTSSVVFEFFHLALESSIFEDEVLPFYIEFVMSSLAKSDVLSEDLKDVLGSLTTVVCTKTSPVRSASDLDEWSPYPIDFSELEGEEGKSATKFLQDFLSDGLESDISNIETIIQATLCLPHVAPTTAQDSVPYLRDILDTALEMLDNEPRPLLPEAEFEPPPRKKKKSIDITDYPRINFNVDSSSNEWSRKLVFLVSVLIEVLHHLATPDDFLMVMDDRKLLSTLRKCFHLRENLHLLKAIDIYLTAVSTNSEEFEITSYESFRLLYPLLSPCLASHKALVRMLTVHIFSLFSLPNVHTATSGAEYNNIFSIMVAVESSPVSPLEYKERLRILGLLDVDFVNMNQPQSRLYDQAPLLFLIGQLYINFKEFWPPVLKMISHYAYALPQDVFWPLWLSVLKVASHFVMRRLCRKEVEEETATTFEDPAIDAYHADLIAHPGYAHLSAKTDYINFRDLLWKGMQMFPDICEKRNKDTVTMFLQFLTDELFPVDFNVAPTQDIAIRDDEEDPGEMYNLDDTTGSVEEHNNSLNPEEEEEEKQTVDPQQRVRKAPTKSLCEYLSLFAKLRNPKVMFKSRELEEMYSEFLSHPYPKVQKLALECLMTYNHKFLVPYKDTLHNILDDKNFKNEITLFDIEGKGEDEARSLKEEHRKDFMPFLMRILYGKMLNKTGNNTAGKANAGIRKGIVIRFLAGASEIELETFLNLTFDIMLSNLEGKPLDVVQRVDRELDPKKVVPLKRIQGALGTMETIFDKIGYLLVNKRPFMLKVVLFVVSMCGSLLGKRENLCSHFLPLLKTLRQISLQKLTRFFTDYSDYPWSASDLEAVLQAAVWPVLGKLHDEGIYSPSPLLRLLSCWAKTPAYHQLLALHHPKDKSLTPMPFLMKLINHTKCSASVISAVYNLVGNLLKTPETASLDDETPPIVLPTLKHVLPLSRHAEKRGIPNLTLGESLVFSCMEGLLTNLKNKLYGLKKDQAIREEDLAVLIRLVDWIIHEEDANEFLDAIIPLLKKGCVKQNDKVCYLLHTCSNLVRMTTSKEKYADDFLRLFSVVDGQSAREALCQVIGAIYGPQGSRVVKWCADSNSRNPELADEIDAERRLKCSREINFYLKTTKALEEAEIVFLIHQNMWVLHQGGDQAMSDLALIAILNFIDAIARLHPNNSSTLGQLEDEYSSTAVIALALKVHLLPLLMSGLKAKKETVRMANLKVLCAAVHKCSHLNPKLEGLLPLADVHDSDNDFFSNMTHLQRGRRTRTLMKLATQLQEGKWDLQTETIVEFVLPIVSIYLFNEEFASDADLLTGSIVCIGALARKLPWNHYQHLLQQYLKITSRELSQLKLGVRVLEVVIDAFHEDISDLEESEFLLKKEVKPTKGKPAPSSAQETPTSESTEMEADEEEEAEDTKAKAQQVYLSLTRTIIPKIQQTLAQRSKRDLEHKVNKKKYAEDEDVKRIPLALALVKLLKKLPKSVLKSNVNNILSKLVAFLRSRLESIRREARNMLVKVMVELGGEYFSCLVSDMNAVLARGYQSHVMVFTLHSVLMALQGSISVSNIGSCLAEIMEICIEDLFGDKAEEKGVAKLSAKVKEVRAEKGYSIIGIVSQIITVNQVQLVMMPLREKLQTFDKKVINKVVMCLERMGNGLERNKNITLEHKSLFVYGILNEKIKELQQSVTPGEKKQSSKLGHKIIRQDCLLLQPEPRKVGHTPKTSVKTTSHILIEFSLNLFSHLLKRDHFNPSNNHHCGLLDAYLPILSKCLASEYPEVAIKALQAIGVIAKFNLPSLEENTPTLIGKMFLILKKFSSSGLTKGKLFELVQLDFRIIAIFLKEVPFFKPDEEQCKILLYYARNNLDDPNLHHSSFLILNAIINQKIQTPELPQLMGTIQKMSITSTNMNMLDQARRTYLNYVVNYPMKKKKYVDILYNYLKDVSYDVLYGRMSATLMLNDLMHKYSRDVFDIQVENTIWFLLSKQLIKEEVKEQKSVLSKLLKTLFTKSERKQVLIDKCQTLLEDDILVSKAKNALSVNMGAQSLLAMLDVPVFHHPLSVLKEVIPKVVDLLHPARYNLTDDVEDPEEAACLDLALNSLLDLFLKLMDSYCSKGTMTKWNEYLKVDVWGYIKDHLLYPNLNVRLTSSVLLGKLFALYPPERGTTPPGASSVEEVESLVIDLCEQLSTDCSVETPLLTELGLAVVRNLIFLIRQGGKVPLTAAKAKVSKITDADDNEDEESNEMNPIAEGSLQVLKRVSGIAHFELKRKGKVRKFLRECFLNLIAGVVVVLGEDFQTSNPLIIYIISHLTRELSDQKLQEDLTSRTKEVADLVRDRIGAERYSEEVVRAQTALSKRKNQRKVKDKQRMVQNPQLAMQKKVKKHNAKKESKKRKITELRLKPNKKRRLRDLAIVKA